MKLILALAWRNLWRNGRRTLLSSGAVAAMVFMLIFALSMQLGSYRLDWSITAAGPMHGHVQVQHPEYIDDPRVRYVLEDVATIADRVRSAEGVRAVTTRALSFALASAGERTFGAMVQGVEADSEQAVSWLPATVTQGRYIEGDAPEAVIGELLARNLDLGIGDELVLLGVTPEDGVAVLVANIVGLVASGQAALDRQLVHVPLALFQDAFDMAGEAHSVAVMYEHYGQTGPAVERLSADLATPEVSVVGWSRLMPEIEQAIASDLASALVMYAILVTLVTFSIANTFVMMIFERTREFGTLLAMGAKPRVLVATVQLETLFLATIGAAVGAVAGIVGGDMVGQIGISLGSEAEEIMAQFQMPDRIYFGVAWPAVIFAPLIMIVTTQLAALVAGRRVQKMRIVDAVREEL